VIYNNGLSRKEATLRSQEITELPSHKVAWLGDRAKGISVKRKEDYGRHVIRPAKVVVSALEAFTEDHALLRVAHSCSTACVISSKKQLPSQSQHYWTNSSHLIP
jgi:hypothetical protein